MVAELLDFLSRRLCFKDITGSTKGITVRRAIIIPVIILVHIGFGSIDSRIIMNPKKKAKSCTQSNIGVITKVIMLKTIGFFKVFIFSTYS